MGSDGRLTRRRVADVQWSRERQQKEAQDE